MLSPLKQNVREVAASKVASAGHLVDAAFVAQLCGTTCAAHREQDAASGAKASALDIKSAVDVELERRKKTRRLAEAESLVTNYLMGAKLVDQGEPVMGHKDEYEYSTFNSLVENLWRLEQTLSLAETITKQEVVAAAQVVGQHKEATSDKCPQREE